MVPAREVHGYFFTSRSACTPQHHPPPKVEAEDVGKAASVDLKHPREESVRFWRMQNTTAPSHLPPKAGTGKEGKARTARAKARAAKPILKYRRGKSIKIWRVWNTTSSFSHKTQNKKGICYTFQRGHCTSNPCPAGRDHCCIGCGKANVPYEPCRCIDNVVVF